MLRNFSFVSTQRTSTPTLHVWCAFYAAGIVQRRLMHTNGGVMSVECWAVNPKVIFARKSLNTPLVPSRVLKSAKYRIVSVANSGT
jgi:hypothetical protein